MILLFFKMINKNLPYWKKIHTIIFDFDGVFTDNKVIINEKGEESVICNRSDGLAIELLNNLKKESGWNLELLILTREKNKVVTKRAEKLKIKCFHGIENKLKFIKKFLVERSLKNDGLIYLGNDINDIESMEFSGYSVAPCDAYKSVQNISDLIINKKGGDGFIREFVEKLLHDQDLIKLL